MRLYLFYEHLLVRLGLNSMAEFPQSGSSVSLDIDNSIKLAYSSLFVEQINHAADEAVWSSDYINEVFMHFYMRIIETCSVSTASTATRVLFKGHARDWPNAVAAARHKGQRIGFSSQIIFCTWGAALYLLSFILVTLSALVLPGMTVITRKRKSTNLATELAVIRSPASYGKMRFLSDSGSVMFYYDDLFQKRTSEASLYSLGNLKQRALSLLVVPLLALRDYFNIMNDARRLLGWCYTGFVLYYYSKRMAHKCNFEYYLHIIIGRKDLLNYYTGNKEDRFALLEKRLCKKYSVRSVCVPHGIEYAFRTPAGLVGDVFYCTTEHARQHLTKLYPDGQEFIFDEQIARNMFSRRKACAPVEDIVFFPESRGAGVNLSIVKHLLDLGRSICLKLHPSDSVENYKEYADRVTFVNDFDTAICNKICLARKSTVLIEAIYNNSIPIAILTDERDRGYVEHMLPSLVDPQIVRVYSYEELASVLAGLHASS